MISNDKIKFKDNTVSKGNDLFMLNLSENLKFFRNKKDFKKDEFKYTNSKESNNLNEKLNHDDLNDQMEFFD
jgi:hypothetical protein